MGTTTQLTLYNGALRLLKHTKLATLTDDLQVRYALDDIWADGAVNYCLEQGLWYFGARSSRLDADPGFTASFGFVYRFEKPSDWVRTMATAIDQYYSTPLTHMLDEAGSWFADMTPIYVRYVSNDADYGNNLGIWPQTFTLYVEAYLALQAAPGLTASGELVKEIEAVLKMRLLDARSKAAMNESAQFLPVGSWVRARYGNRAIQDRGSIDKLIG